MIINPYMFGGVSLLLDTYSGSAFAYSLRKLSTSYSGYAVKVRRSSDNSEQNIGFSGNDLDTTSLLSFVGSSNGYITTLYDQSGNGKNATNTTASQQAQIVNNGTLNTMNGKPCFIPVGYGYDLTSTNISCLITVSKSVASSGYSVLTNSPTVVTALNWNNNYLLYYDGGFKTFYTVSNNTQYLTYFNRQSSRMYMSLNGSSPVDSGSSTITFNVNKLFYFSGGISNNEHQQELIGWSAEQSANQSLIKLNINNYYGIY